MTGAALLKQAVRSLCVGATAFAWPAPARAEGALFGPGNVSVLLDLRLAAAEGERSWTDGGFGKGRFGGAEDGGLRVRPALAEGSLIWQPRLAWDLGGTLVAAVQQGQDKPVDLVEAFLTYKPVPKGNVRLSGRAGLYWPAISLEHEGAAWSVADMITPSAINSWVGEEVKVLGAEGTVSAEVGSNQLSATFGIFGFNDTAGTLLAFRGWALHDLKATAFGHQKLPPLNAFMQEAQAPTTKPLAELDGRPGFYAKAAWQLAAPVRLEAFHYDNRGDPEAVRNGQWGWETRFWNLGARIDLDGRTRLLAQALTGTTEMGYADARGYWVETRFRSLYLRGTHEEGPVTFSARFDLFDSDESGAETGDDEEEKGWSAAAAGSLRLSERSTIVAEAIRIESERAARYRLGEASEQAQTIVQTSLRTRF